VGEVKRRLDELEMTEAKGKEGRDRWKKLSREVEIKEHEIRLLAEQVEGSNAARVRASPLRHRSVLISSSDRD
jgi:structural maintenance of chromosome 2